MRTIKMVVTIEQLMTDHGRANDGNNGESGSIDEDGFGAAVTTHGGDSRVGIDSGLKMASHVNGKLYRCRYEEGYNLYDHNLVERKLSRSSSI